MYVPPIHQSKDMSEVYDYIRTHGFATLISEVDGKKIASHLPMYLDQDDNNKYRLLGHIAAANELKDSLDGQQELLAIFMEQHAYISSSWYNHINVPTWNYVAIHVYGKATMITGEELVSSLEKLVQQYEADRPGRFNMTDMSDQMLKAHLKGLVGFSFSIDSIESSFKLSQNRNDKDYKNIIQQLEKENDQGSHSIAQQMNKLRS